VPLFNSRLERWHQHFMWSEDLLSIIGCPETGGRATIDALNMNIAQRVNLRRALRELGKHPVEIG